MLSSDHMCFNLVRRAICAFALIILVIPTASQALPPVFKHHRTRVREIACELLLSGDRQATFIRMLKDKTALELEGEDNYDIFGVLHDLAGADYGKMTESMRSSPARMRTLRAQGGASVGALLNTPVSDLMRIDSLIEFRFDEKIVDLGSGHGAPALFFGALHPETDWLGLELVREKVAGAELVALSLELHNVQFRQSDLSDPELRLPAADTYYLLNPVETPILVRLFEKMREVSKTRKVRIVALGIEGATPLLDLSWLSYKRYPTQNILEPSLFIFESLPHTP